MLLLRNILCAKLTRNWVWDPSGGILSISSLLKIPIMSLSDYIRLKVAKEFCLYDTNYTAAWRYELYFLVAKTTFYSIAALVRKILFSLLENEIYMFAPRWNILYNSWLKDYNIPSIKLWLDTNISSHWEGMSLPINSIYRCIYNMQLKLLSRLQQAAVSTCFRVVERALWGILGTGRGKMAPKNDWTSFNTTDKRHAL